MIIIIMTFYGFLFETKSKFFEDDLEYPKYHTAG